MNLFHLTRPTESNQRLEARTLRHRRNRAGQALVEFAMVAVIMLLLLMGLVDYGRILMTRQVLVNVTREGSNLACRGIGTTNVINTLVISAQPLSIASNGYVILSTVTRDSSGIARVIAQVTGGGMISTSKVGVVGATGSAVRLPNNQIPQTNQSVYVTEVFYRFQPATPVGNLLSTSLNGTLYDVAFF